MATDIEELMDADGENQAVRDFLAVYQSDTNCTIKTARLHMRYSGWDKCWPEWAAITYGHLTKSGAQDWLRHLFSLEQPSSPSVVTGMMIYDLKERAKNTAEAMRATHWGQSGSIGRNAIVSAALELLDDIAQLEQPSSPSVGTDERYLLCQIINALPTNRDWLDPDIERAARTLLSQTAPAIHFVSRNDGSQPEDTAHLDCPACGGSGHIDDYTAAPAVDADARDAERYRALVASGAYSPTRLPDCPWGLRTGFGRASKQELDAAADAAIAAQRERT